MKKLLFTLAAGFLAITANAQLLWKVSGNELATPSYILGTHHLAPLSILDSIQGYQEAFESTAQVVGELDMSLMQSPEVMQMMQKTMMIESDTTLQTLFTPEEYEKINTLSKELLMLDLAMAPKLKPSFLNMNLIVMLYLKHVGDFDPSVQLDGYLQQLGISNGKKVAALETMDFQFNMLFNGSSLQRQAQQLNCMVDHLDVGLESARKLTEAYMKQDLNEVEAVSLERQNNQCDYTPGELEAMIDNRNINWANELPAIMQETPSFVVVGALHLPGNNGVLNLLKQKGYTVEPVI